MLRPTPKGVTFEGNEKYEGFTIDLLNRISEDLQFKYEIILSPENSYGQKGKNGQWTGIVGSIRAMVSSFVTRILLQVINEHCEQMIHWFGEQLRS